MPRFLLRTYHGSKILQFDTGSSFLLKIHVIFYCQYAKFRKAAYKKVHLELLQSFFKIKLKVLSKLSKKFVNKFCSPYSCAIPNCRKNISNKLCLNMKILTEKKPLNIIHFLIRQYPYSVWTITQDLIKLGTYNISNLSYKFSFPKIFKIKDKILINFSLASHTAS